VVSFFSVVIFKTRFENISEAPTTVCPTLRPSASNSDQITRSIFLKLSTADLNFVELFSLCGSVHVKGLNEG
jgi:hypothetical protein